MKTVEIICNICANNCPMHVELDADGVVDVTGNNCMRGYAYAQQECVYVDNPGEIY